MTSQGLVSIPIRLKLAGQSLVAFHDWTFTLGPQFCSGFGNGLLLGYLMYKSQLVPPRVALVGLIQDRWPSSGASSCSPGRSTTRVRPVPHHRPGDRMGGVPVHLSDVLGIVNHAGGW